METIQYSLKDNISIDIRLALECSQKSNDKTNEINQDKNCIFDTHCLEIYGKRTCILFQLSEDTYQARFLNKSTKKIINKKSFYMIIPSLVEDAYTVVIVDDIDYKKEIVAIHSPSNIAI
jgi:hypothetical protein